MCDTRTLFARHGIRCTRQRLLLYTALMRADRHPTAEELHAQVKERSCGLSLATVYNALEVFQQKGLCHRLPARGGGVRYDADLREHLHITTDDGSIRDVPEDLGVELLDAIPRSALREVERRTGVRISRITIELHGKPAASENTSSKLVIDDRIGVK